MLLAVRVKSDDTIADADFCKLMLVTMKLEFCTTSEKLKLRTPVFLSSWKLRREGDVVSKM